MDNLFTPSVNIIRDLDKTFHYILTPNAERIFEQLDNSYSSGNHSFNIIGSFGTGKSSFLLALEKHLKGEKQYFEFSPVSLNSSLEPKFVNIVGSYRPFADVFSEALEPGNKKSPPLTQLESLYKKVRKEGKRLVIIVDEFGKFLEYAAANNPEKELFFVQQLAEFANDVDREILFITTLHQNFQAYTNGLDLKQRREWEKVKGRFKEIAFNEPVEQLLFLASKFLGNAEDESNWDSLKKLRLAIKRARLFSLNDQQLKDIAPKLLPLDMAAASVLTLALQRYGQNERSLFYFLQSNDINGLSDYDEVSNPYYNVSCVYDYLLQNYYSFLSTKFNPDYMQWMAIRSALERAEPIFNHDDDNFDHDDDNLSHDYDNAAKLIKTIGLLSIFSSRAGKIDFDFLPTYAELSLNIKKPIPLINQLTSRKILRYREFESRYVLFEGTDLDIDLAVKDAASYVEPPQDITPILKNHFHFPYILAKANFFETGTPRFFEIVFSESPIDNQPKNDIDGFVNIVFNQSIKASDLQEKSGQSKEAILYGLYLESKEISDLIWEIEKVKYVLGKSIDDRVAHAELKLLFSHLSNELNRRINDCIYSSEGSIKWFFQGEEKILKTRRAFNSFLSEISSTIYNSTPTLKNELINKQTLSSAMSTARKYFLKQFVEKWDKQDLGIPEHKFPPEKTVYLSLLKQTGIHTVDEKGFVSFSKPADDSFKPLWEKSEEFLESAKTGKKSIEEFIAMLSAYPYKVKFGLLEFWIPIFLFINRDTYALFKENTYVPEPNWEVFFLMTKRPGLFFVKTFNIEGVRLDLFNKYRELLNKAKEEKLTKDSFTDTIKPFLTFYIHLPEYTKKTARLSPSTIAFREAISKATDLEKAFFEDFPRAFDFTIQQLTESPENLQEFTKHLKNGIDELKNCLGNLLDSIEKYIQEELNLKENSFTALKKALKNRYRSLKKHLVLPHQKPFFNALISDIDERPSWLASLVHSVLGKNINTISDREVEKFFPKLSRMFSEFDNLCDFSKLGIDSEKEEAFKLEITNFTGTMQSQLIRYPTKLVEKNDDLKSKLRAVLTRDKTTNQAVLLSLLKEELKK